MAFHPVLFLYHLYERIVIWLFSPKPPTPGAVLRGPKIAIIGAGITGVSSAAHCVGHGCDVVLFEGRTEEYLGGIWARVNKTSGLQIHSVMYRFHPAVHYDSEYPKRDAILAQVRGIWEQYGLKEKTRFSTDVTKVEQRGSKWIVNGNEDEKFDGIIAAVGTCGEPKMTHLQGSEKFHGKILHSSQLDGVDVAGKNVAIIGGGASAIEALEYCVAKDAGKINILSRSDKWIIPRNPLIDGLLSMNIFGYETFFSIVPEFLLRQFFYRDLKELAPEHGQGLYQGTPMCNDQVLDQIREGKAEWLRGDIKTFEEKGIKFNHRQQGTPKGGVGHEIIVPTDVIIQATGFHRPSLSFLPEECFVAPYSPPNWYLQVFPPGHSSVCANNCTFINAVGIVGAVHIGVYTRILLMFLVDPLTRPPAMFMRKWVDVTKWLKRRAPTAAFDFFTYAELLWWFVFVCVINPFRWKWAIFVLFGFGEKFALDVVHVEEKIWGYEKLKRGPI